MSVLRGAAHWVMARVFGISWCDVCRAFSSVYPDERRPAFTAQRVFCSSCWTATFRKTQPAFTGVEYQTDEGRSVLVPFDFGAARD